MLSILKVHAKHHTILQGRNPELKTPDSIDSFYRQYLTAAGTAFPDDTVNADVTVNTDQY